jgi:Spy/CpxP family protein refolding chaperone
MQKIGLIALVAGALGCAASFGTPVAASEEPANPRERPPAVEGLGVGFERVERELKLTEAQKAQLHAVQRDFEQQENDIRQDSLLSRPDQERRMHALLLGLDSRVKAFLTADQIQKFDQMGGWEGAMHGPRGLESVWRELTPAQRASIDGLLAQQQPSFAAAAKDEAKLRALKQTTWQQIMAILTPPQQQKLKAAAERSAAERELEAKARAEREQAEKGAAEKEHEGQ